MATDVETLLVKLEARITDFEKKMGQAERRAATGARKIQNSFNAIPGVANKALGLIGVGLSAKALLDVIKNGIEAGQVIGDMADKLGVGTEALQELGFVAKQNGASLDDIQTGFRGLTKFLGEASKGTDKAVNVLHQLGFTFDELRDKSPDKIFVTLLDAIGKIQNPLQRNATLMQVFGKAGTQLAQVAALGADKLRAQREEAQRLGVVLSDNTVRALQDAGDKVDLLNDLWTAGSGAIATAFIPALNAVVDVLTSPGFQDSFKEFTRSLSEGIATDLRDLDALRKAIVGIGLLIRDTASLLGSGLISSTSATDQPSPGPGGDAAIQNRGKLMERIGDAAEGAAGSTQHLTEEMVKNSDSFKAAQAKALGLTTTYDTLGGVTDDQAKAQKKAGSEAERAAKKYDDEAKELQFLTEQVGRSKRDMFIFNAVNDSGADISTAAGKAIAEQAGHLFDLQEALERTIERMDLFRDVAKTGLGTFISDLREGKSATEALGNALDRVLDKLLDFALDQVVNGLLGKTGEVGGGLLAGLIPKASGGNVSRNQALLVGERGPEIFVPRTSGVIGTARGGGGFKVETHYHNNAGVRVTEQQTPTKQGVRLDVMIDEIVASKGMDPSSKTGRMLAVRGGGPIRR